MTFRDLEILRLLHAGKPDDEIARQIGVRKAEYRSSLDLLLRKIGVSSREEAVRISVREGWISGSKPEEGNGR